MALYDDLIAFLRWWPGWSSALLRPNSAPLSSGKVKPFCKKHVILENQPSLLPRAGKSWSNWPRSTRLSLWAARNYPRKGLCSIQDFPRRPQTSWGGHDICKYSSKYTEFLRALLPIFSLTSLRAGATYGSGVYPSCCHWPLGPSWISDLSGMTVPIRHLNGPW